MTGQQTTDADLIEIVAKSFWDGRERAMQRDYGAMYTGISWEESGRDNRATYQAIAESIITVVQPIIAAQARAEGRREVIDIIEASFEKVLNPLSGATGWQDRGVRMWFELARKDIEALDTGAAADGGEESR